jgi:hypothetical protein
MPEGPEIRRAADVLAAAMQGTPLRKAWFAFAALTPHEASLPGRRIEAIAPHGNAMLIHFDHGLALYSHNQLYGVWCIAPARQRPSRRWTLRVALETGQRAILLYSASDILLWPTERVHQHPFLHRIGPDVLDPSLEVVAVAARLQQPRFVRRHLGALLLDQAFLAGLGTTSGWKSCGRHSSRRDTGRSISMRRSSCSWPMPCWTCRVARIAPVADAARAICRTPHSASTPTSAKASAAYVVVA